MNGPFLPYATDKSRPFVLYLAMARDELTNVLDYILNRAGPGEFEAVVKACERRRRDQGRFAGLGGLNPGALASRMAASVQEGVDESVERLRGTVRDYVARIVRQREPGASDEQIEALLDSCLPDRRPGADGGSGWAPGDGSDSGLPPEALAAMVRDFCDFSLGAMPPSKQKELWDNLPDWKDLYWKTFPPSVKAFVKAYLEGRMDDEEFWSAVLSVLGL